MVSSARRRLLALPRLFLAWAMVAVFVFPFVQELIPRVSAQTMSCCRTKKTCCCRKSAKPGDGRPGFKAVNTSCQRACQGTLGGIQALAIEPARSGILSAPPLPLHRAAHRFAPLPPSHDPDPLYGRPPPVHS